MEVQEGSCSILERKKKLRMASVPPPATLPKSTAVLEALKDIKSSKSTEQGVSVLSPLPVAKKRQLSEPPLKSRTKRKKQEMSSEKPQPPMKPANALPTAAPVPKPRKKGPPPSKPVPYRQHLVHKSNEVTTFKSNLPIQPQLRPHPPLPSAPGDSIDSSGYSSIKIKQQNRVSLKGEPSERFYSPVECVQKPVECGIPIIPIDRRPRLNTPLVLPDPSVVCASRTISSASPKLNDVSEGNELPSHSSSSSSSSFPLRDVPPAVAPIETRPRLYTPAVPPDPDKVLPSVMSSSSSSPQPKARRRPPLKPAHALASASDNSLDIVGEAGTGIGEYDLVCSDKAANGGSGDGDDGAGVAEYVVANGDGAKKVNLVEQVVKKDSTSSPLHHPTLSPLPLQATPMSLTEAEYDVVAENINGHVTLNPSLPSPSLDREYSVTSHVQSNKIQQVLPPSAVPPITSLVKATPIVPEGNEYSVTSHVQKNIIGQVSSSSVVPPISSLAKATPTDLKGEEYSTTSHVLSPVLKLSGLAAVGSITLANTGDEYSKLPTSAAKSVNGFEEDEGYSLIDTRKEKGKRGGEGEGGRQKEQVLQDPEYDVIINQPVPPVRKRSGKTGTHSHSSSSPIPPHSSSVPPTPPSTEPKGSKPRPAKPPRLASINSKPPSGPVSPKPSRKAPGPPPLTPKPAVSPKLNTKSQGLSKLKEKPPPLSMKPVLREPTMRYEMSKDASTNLCPYNDEEEMTVSPLVEIDIDRMVQASMLKSQEDSNRENMLSLSRMDKSGTTNRKEEEKEAVRTRSEGGQGAEDLRRKSYENQQVVNAHSVSLPAPLSGGGVVGGSYIEPLSPSEVFTVPQHAIPGPLNYCQVDVDQISASSLATPPLSASLSGEGEVSTHSPRMYPDSQGYCDLNIKTVGHERKVSGLDGRDENASTGETLDDIHNQHASPKSKSTSNEPSQELEQSSQVGNEKKDGAVSSRNVEERDVEGEGYIQQSSSSNDAVGSSFSEVNTITKHCNITLQEDQLIPPTTSSVTPTSTAPASLVTSNESISMAVPSPGSVAIESDVSRSSQRSQSLGSETDNIETSTSPKPIRCSSRKKGTSKQYGPRRTLSSKRRPPPPPPPPSTPRPSLSSDVNSKSKPAPRDLSTAEDRVLRSGFCTLPRATRTGRGAPPRALRPPPPPIPYNTRKKSDDTVGHSQPQSPSPFISPSLTSSPSSSSSSPSSLYLGPPQGLVSSSEVASSPGLKKKLMGFLKKTNATGPEFIRQGSLRRSKKKKLKQENIESVTREGMMSKALPRASANSSMSSYGKGVGVYPQQCGVELEAEDEVFERGEMEEEGGGFGIYSIIPEPRTEKNAVAATSVALRSTSVNDDIHSVGKKSGNAAYDLIQSEGGIIDGQYEGTNRQSFLPRSSSAEHLYEPTNFSKSTKEKTTKASKLRGTKSMDNSPHEIRRLPETQHQQQLSLEDSGGLGDDGLYAQVLVKESPQLSSRRSDSGKSDERKGSGEVGGAEMGSAVEQAVGDRKGSRVLHDGQTLVITYHALPTKNKEMKEEVISSGDIEHMVSGDATYAVVTSKKKKKKNGSGNAEQEDATAAVASELGSESITECSEGEGGIARIGEASMTTTTVTAAATTTTTTAAAAVGEDDERENKDQKNIAERDEMITPPTKPRRSLKKEKIPPPKTAPKPDGFSPPCIADVSVTPSTPTSMSARTRAIGGPSSSRRSPVRQAPPLPPSGKSKSPSPGPQTLHPTLESSDSPPCPPQAAVVSNGPPAFPPPPPPPQSKSPSPAPPDAVVVEDHTYAVVQLQPKQKRMADVSLLIDEWLSSPNQGASENAGGKRTVSEVPRKSSTKKTPRSNNKPSIYSSTSVSSKPSVYTSSSVKKESHSNSFKNKEKMRQYPSLPPRHTPPPPPPVPAPSAPGDGEAGGKRTGSIINTEPCSGGDHQFLFSQNYASTLIKVGEDSSSAVNGDQDDSDGVFYSTEWETSSDEEAGEEDGEEPEESDSKGSGKPSTPRSKIFYIAQEILTTERTYVKGLTLLDKDFRQAVKSANNAHEKPVISDENMKSIMGNVGSILTLNSGLLEELETRMALWDEKPLIGDILLGRAPYFKIYTEYISRFDNALKTLDEQKRNSVFASVLQEFESQPKCANIPLAGYMLDVVQRITRYKLLFADYVKHLPEDSEDRIPSEKALAVVANAATHVNETIRQMDNFRKVMEVRKKLIGDYGDTLITPSRQLVKEGELTKFSRKEKQLRMFFLFSDILIYASAVPPTNTTYKVIKRIPLEGMKVDLIEDPEMRHAFQIISTCKSFRLEASNEKDRIKWFEAFEKSIKELSERSLIKQKSRMSKIIADGVEEVDAAAPLGSLAPPWLPDSSVSMCQLCSYNFTMTRRRHHCRACGMIFCGDCSGYFAPLKYKKNKICRVCQTCFEKLSESESPTKRTKASQKSHKQVSMPSVLREVRARDQSAQISGYLLISSSKARRWKKRWFVVYNLVLYEFERHEDVSAKRSITLPSYQVSSRHNDPLVLCLRHPGTGKEYLKADTEEQVERWMEVLKKAAVGDIDDSYSPYSFHSASSSSLTLSHPPSSLCAHNSPPVPSTQLTPHNEEDADVDRDDSEEREEEGGGEKDKDDASSNETDGSYSNC